MTAEDTVGKIPEEKKPDERAKEITDQGLPLVHAETSEVLLKGNSLQISFISDLRWEHLKLVRNIQ